MFRYDRGGEEVSLQTSPLGVGDATRTCWQAWGGGGEREGGYIYSPNGVGAELGACKGKLTAN